MHRYLPACPRKKYDETIRLVLHNFKEVSPTI